MKQHKKDLLNSKTQKEKFANDMEEAFAEIKEMQLGTKNKKTLKEFINQSIKKT